MILTKDCRQSASFVAGVPNEYEAVEKTSRAQEIRNYLLYVLCSATSVAAIIVAGEVIIHMMHGTA